MSTYTYLYTDLWFCGKSYNHKHEVEKDLEEAKNWLSNCQTSIRQLIMMTEPRKFMPEDCDDPMWWLQRHTDDLMNDYEEALTNVNNLQLLLDKWGECHDKDGHAIGRPKGVLKYGRSYLEGDYIDSYYEDGTPKPVDDYED